MKKYIETAEVELITLDANDIVTSSFEKPHEGPGYNEDGYDGGYAPTRNYRGVEMDWEEQDW